MKLEKRGDAPAQDTDQKPVEKEKISEKNLKKREISVIIYTTVLFAIALALILLSYAMQKSANTAISDISQKHGEFSTQAMKNIEELQEQNRQLTEELEQERHRGTALLALARLLSAPEDGDKSVKIDAVESQLEYLDGEALEIYNSYVGN